MNRPWMRGAMFVAAASLMACASAPTRATAAGDSAPTPASSPARDKGPLPASWLGTWKGSLDVSRDGKTQPRHMTLTVASVAGSPAYRFEMTTLFQGKTSIREYELVPQDDAPGHFVIDEKNGILLDAWLVGDVLYTYFLDQPILITSRYERRDGGLLVEMASVETASPRTTRATGSDIVVHSYQLGNLQKGLLRSGE